MSDQGENDWFSEDAATFGDRMAAAREAAGMSQAELARRLGVKIKTVMGWEQDTSEPRANKLQMLAGLLNVSITWLLTGEGDGVEPPSEESALAHDASVVMTEMRQLRGEMGRLNDRLGRLEKRLRTILKEAV